MKYYHGTPAANLPAILEDGILPSRYVVGKAVCLTPHPAEALYWARLMHGEGPVVILEVNLEGIPSGPDYMSDPYSNIVVWKTIDSGRVDVYERIG